jgi:hypothetical protein
MVGMVSIHDFRGGDAGYDMGIGNDYAFIDDETGTVNDAPAAIALYFHYRRLVVDYGLVINGIIRRYGGMLRFQAHEDVRNRSGL